MSKTKVIEEILGVVRQYKTFVISSHTNPDGDAIGSQLTFCSFLSEFGKEVFILNSDPVPFGYRFLLNPNCPYTELDSDTNSGDASSCNNPWEDIEVWVVLDCGNLRRLWKGFAPKIGPRHALINIDHHLGNECFGTHNLVDPNASATGELIFHLMEYSGIKIDQYRATCLYTAILTDTGSFKFSNTTAEAHRVVARLIELGARPDRIAEEVYEVIPYQRAKLFGMALETLKLSHDGKIAYMWVTREMFNQTGTKSEDTEGFVEYVRSLRDIEIGIFFRELENSGVKVSFRSKGDLDANKIAASFGGGGHHAAAGCVIFETLEKSIEMILTTLADGNRAFSKPERYFL